MERQRLKEAPSSYSDVWRVCAIKRVMQSTQPKLLHEFEFLIKSKIILKFNQKTYAEIHSFTHSFIMSQSTNSGGDKSIFEQKDLEKSHEILTCTVKAPPFSYAHLQLITDGSEEVELDNLQIKSYCTAALRQFLGIAGTAIPMDILKVHGSHCWVRVPRPDLGSFAAAITAWRGTTEGSVQSIFQIRSCSDWLGSMVGSDGQDKIWNS